jgi:phenylalanyl-tRNA synthetase beta chain
MLVSAFELQISDDHEGIIELPDDARSAQLRGLGRARRSVIEINLTPNRADCTGVSGIARDLAAAAWASQGPLRSSRRRRFPCPVKVTLDSAPRPSLCPAFALRSVRGGQERPLARWLQRRLIAIGLRPINALVDITKFITYDRGRPLHVFDAAKVHGNLTVRRARAGESPDRARRQALRADETICVIADEQGVESLAGIMGGEATGCSETTTDVLIESALWEPLNIAQSGRKLGINSDARYRFERGVDPAFMLPGLELATRMVLDLCGGEALRGDRSGHAGRARADD